MALREAAGEVKPRANNAAGTTTVKAPYNQDNPSETLVNQSATVVDSKTATNICAANTRQTDIAG
jgi:hypothetical protein